MVKCQVFKVVLIFCHLSGDEYYNWLNVLRAYMCQSIRCQQFQPTSMKLCIYNSTFCGPATKLLGNNFEFRPLRHVGKTTHPDQGSHYICRHYHHICLTHVLLVTYGVSDATEMLFLYHGICNKHH